MKDVFPERLKQERQKAKLSQEDLARICKNRDGHPLTRAAVSLWEQPGSNRPSYENLLALAKEMRVSLDYLTGLSEKKEPIPSRPNVYLDNLADCIRIYESMLPADQFRIPPAEKAKIIGGMYKMIQPDGSIQTADIIELVQPLKERYVGVTDEHEVGGVSVNSNKRVSRQSKNTRVSKLRR